MAASNSLRADAPEFVPTDAPVSSAKTTHKEPTVADVASQAAVISADMTLSDVADVLGYTGHSSAVFVGEDGCVKGIFTENDILKAYSEEVSSDLDADIWLRSNQARLPGFLLPMLTVDASAPLADAAAKMATQRLTHFACHHLLVEGGAPGCHQILSALDITAALCNGELGADAVGRLRSERLVSDVMKLRGTVPECKGSDPIKRAFDYLLSAEQNCALVVQEHSNFVYGVITPRDALRAYGEHIPEGTAVGGWLRGLRAKTSKVEPRRVASNASLLEAAQAMVAGSLHHLCVVAPGTDDVVGVVSCLDIVCRIGEVRLETPAAPGRDAHPAWQ